MQLPGQIILLNGAPRSGKTSIAKAIQESFPGVWINLGVDTFMRASPENIQPSIGLRPGGERPDLEPYVDAVYDALFETIAAMSRTGLNIVVDVGLHDSYATLRNVPLNCLKKLEGLPLLVVAVRCPVDALVMRRRASGRAVAEEDGEEIKGRLLLWDREVHRWPIYDLEVDTSTLEPKACAEAIGARLATIE